jgi:hypothetical protein
MELMGNNKKALRAPVGYAEDVGRSSLNTPSLAATPAPPRINGFWFFLALLAQMVAVAVSSWALHTDWALPTDSNVMEFGGEDMEEQQLAQFWFYLADAIFPLVTVMMIIVLQGDPMGTRRRFVRGASDALTIALTILQRSLLAGKKFKDGNDMLYVDSDSEWWGFDVEWGYIVSAQRGASAGSRS